MQTHCGKCILIKNLLNCNALKIIQTSLRYLKKKKRKKKRTAMGNQRSGMNKFRTLIYFHAGAGHRELNPLSVKGLNYLQPMFPSCKNDTFNPFVHNVEKWPHIISKFGAKFFLRCSQCKILKVCQAIFQYFA